MRKILLKTISNIFSIKICNCEICQTLKYINKSITENMQNNSELYQNIVRDKYMRDMVLNGIINIKATRPARLLHMKQSVVDAEKELKVALESYIKARIGWLVEQEGV